MRSNSPGSSSVGLARATSVVGIVTLLSRICGLLRDTSTAAFFGAGFATDAFFVAFRIPNLLRRLVAEGSLTTAFVPIFTEELDKGKEQAQKALNDVAGFCLVLTILLSAFGLIFAEEITLIFAPGWENEPEKLALSTDLLQVMIPYVVTISILALLSGALNALGVFGAPAFAPVILNLTLMAAMFGLHQFFKIPIFTLAYGLVLGGFLSILPQIYYLKKCGFKFRVSSPFNSKPVQRLGKLMIPTVISASVYQLMVLVNSILASLLPEGSVSWLYYADRIFQFPLGVFSIAIATVLLPSFAKLSAAGKLEDLSRQLCSALNWVSYITIPATVGLVVFAKPIIGVCYQHFSFSTQDTLQTAPALIAFALGLWAISYHTVLVRVFLSRKNSKLPAKVAILSLFINALFAIILMGPPIVKESLAAQVITAIQHYSLIGTLPQLQLAHVGLSLAGSIGTFFSMLLLLFFLPSVQIHLQWYPLLRANLKFTLASLALFLSLQGLLQVFTSDITLIFFGIPLGIAVYFAATLALRCEESSLVLKEIFKRSR